MMFCEIGSLSLVLMLCVLVVKNELKMWGRIVGEIFELLLVILKIMLLLLL